MRRKELLLVLLLAFAVSILMLAPQVFFVARDKNYRGIIHFHDDDGLYYVARVQDVLDGHPMLGNPYLAERKDAPPMQFFLPDWLAAAPAKLLRLSAAPVVLWSMLFWIPLLVLLYYAAVRALAGSVYWTALATAAAFFGFLLNTWNRPVSPQTTMPAWMLLFYLLARRAAAADVSAPSSAAGIQTLEPAGRMRRRVFIPLEIIPSRSAARVTQNNSRADSNAVHKFLTGFAGMGAILFGSLFYLYPYGWTFYAALLALFILMAWRRPIGIAPREPLLVLGFGFLLGIPYILSALSALRLPEFAESITRLGMISTRAPSGIRILAPAFLLTLCGFIAMRLRLLRWSARTALAFSGVLAVSLAVNQHIVTGKNLEFSSHYIDTMRLWGVAVAGFLAAEIERGMKARWPGKRLAVWMRRLGLVTVAAFLLYAVPPVVANSFRRAEFTVARQRYEPALELIRRHAQKDDVVFADGALSALIPAFTSANVFFDRNANLFFVSDEEVRDRFLIREFYSPMDAEFLRAHEREVWGVRYIDQAGKAKQLNRLRELFGFKPQPVLSIPEEEINAVLTRAWELRARGFASAVKQYRADWILWDKAANPEWAPLAEMPFLEKAAETENGFVLYRAR